MVKSQRYFVSIAAPVLLIVCSQFVFGAIEFADQDEHVFTGQQYSRL
jgi:hypothetical protein